MTPLLTVPAMRPLSLLLTVPAMRPLSLLLTVAAMRPLSLLLTAAAAMIFLAEIFSNLSDRSLKLRRTLCGRNLLRLSLMLILGISGLLSPSHRSTVNAVPLMLTRVFGVVGGFTGGCWVFSPGPGSRSGGVHKAAWITQCQVCQHESRLAHWLRGEARVDVPYFNEHS